MDVSENPSIHNQIQTQILTVCQNLNIEAKKEHRGKGWRADVFIPNESTPIAFEIQLSAQTLKRTLERQEKYFRDGIMGCWLFEKPIPKLIQERPDLPVFYVEYVGQKLYVNLGDRRKIELNDFLLNFISNKIQFRQIAVAKKTQTIELVFYEMKCWKCQAENLLYYVNKPFLSACNAKIRQEEALWGSNSMEYRTEIIDAAKAILEQKNLRLGEIKPRHSKTADKSYVSFGCYNCDSIFGDFFVFEAKIDLMYDPNKTIYPVEVEIAEKITFNHLPHWCYPENGKFCDED